MYNQNGVYYSEQHSVSFGDLIDRTSHVDFNVAANTWEDWHLIPSSRLSIAHPNVVTNFIELPGKGGMIDLTEAINKKPNYGQRQGSLGFIFDHHFGDVATIYNSIVSMLHGKRIKLRMDDDPAYYYEGRFTVEALEYTDQYPKITISYQLLPYKYKINTDGNRLVIWNTFNFLQDYDYSVFVNGVTVSNETKTYDIYAKDYPFALSVTRVSGTVTVSFGGETKTLSSSGTVEIGKASVGQNELVISGNGKINIEWRGGSL